MKYKGPKGKAWKSFSDYIRLRDCLETTGSPDWCICCTCGKKVPYSQTDPGHAIAGRNNTILLHDELCHGQCKGCNINGNYGMYSLFMIKRYGLEHWEKLCFLARQGKKMVAYQWQEQYEYWNDKLKGLKTI